MALFAIILRHDRSAVVQDVHLLGILPLRLYILHRKEMNVVTVKCLQSDAAFVLQKR